MVFRQEKVGNNTTRCRWPEFDGNSAASDIGPEADAFRIGHPEAHRTGAGSDAVAMGGFEVADHEIPRHRAVRGFALPWQGGVAALPVVAQESLHHREIAAPTEVQPPRALALIRNPQAIWPNAGFDLGINEFIVKVERLDEIRITEDAEKIGHGLGGG